MTEVEKMLNDGNIILASNAKEIQFKKGYLFDDVEGRGTSSVTFNREQEQLFIIGYSTEYFKFAACCFDKSTGKFYIFQEKIRPYCGPNIKIIKEVTFSDLKKYAKESKELEISISAGYFIDANEDNMFEIIEKAKNKLHNKCIIDVDLLRLVTNEREWKCLRNLIPERDEAHLFSITCDESPRGEYLHSRCDVGIDKKTGIPYKKNFSFFVERVLSNDIINITYDELLELAKEHSEEMYNVYFGITEDNWSKYIS